MLDETPGERVLPLSGNASAALSHQAGYHWGLDDESAPNRELDTTNGSGGDALTIAINPTDGWHTLYAQTVDSGGNVSSATTAYSFGVGSAGAAITAPKEGVTTARRVPLELRGLSSYTSAQWQFRIDDGDDWTTVPSADVVAAGSGNAITWPVAMVDGVATKLVWNVASTLEVDSDIQIRALVSSSSTNAYTARRHLALDRANGHGPAHEVGPGSVNLLTGSYSIVATDAEHLGMQVLRRTTSRASEREDERGAAAVEPFGPGWTAGVTADIEGATYGSIAKKSDTSVTLHGLDGETTTTFNLVNGKWTDEDSDWLSLAGTVGGTTFTLTDSAQIVSRFQAAGSPGTWKLATVANLESGDSATVSEAVTSGSEVLGRPKFVMSASSALQPGECHQDLTKPGCRTIEYVYADNTTAEGATVGSFTGRVSEVRLWTASPGATNATPTTVSAYAYDASGRLRQVWDPRIVPALKTSYAYDSADRVVTYTPPGQRGWTLTYGEVGSSATAGPGMLLTASRAGAGEGENSSTTRIVYEVPLSGDKAPYAMSPSVVATWGQKAAPTDATAVLTSGSVSSSLGSDLSKDAYSAASVSYADSYGHAVNEAKPGGHITTQERNADGDVAFELTAANRAMALGTAADATEALSRISLQDETDSAVRAEKLSTIRTYDASTGQILTETGPLHLVTIERGMTAAATEASLAPGDVRPARKRTTYTYDENRPSSAEARDLITTRAEGALLEGYDTLADGRVISYEYDWTTGNLLKEVTDPSGLALAVGYTYASDGEIISTKRPASDAGGSTITSLARWTATGTGACAGRPEWAGMTCSRTIAPSSAPNSGTVITSTYDRWGHPATVTEKTAGQSRSTVRTYDNAGRLTTTATSGGGTNVPTQTITYSASTGLQESTSSNGKKSQSTYDARGRKTIYEDGSGSTTALSYDNQDRLVKLSDSTGASTSYAYTQGADGSPVLTVTDSVAGKFVRLRGADERLESSTLPNGIALDLAYDETGAPIQREYTDVNGTTLLSDSVEYTLSGLYARNTKTAGTTTTTSFTYDTADRLIQSKKTDGDNCEARGYTLDKAGNRTTLTSSPDCKTENNTKFSFDARNQLTGSGFSSDDFGNTTTSNGAIIEYFSDGTPRQVTVGTSRETLSRDAEGRYATTARADNSAGTWSTTSVRTSHYNGYHTAPSWDGTGSATARYVATPEGDLLAITDTRNTALQLSDIQENIAVELSLATGTATVRSYDEFGNTSSGPLYGWRGARQEAEQRLLGFALLNGRGYFPGIGRYASPPLNTTALGEAEDATRDNAFNLSFGRAN
ncbi:hypothetical protein [Streptomyces cyaneofuscatus]|uniref:hypothetical protein n=1 Tax=Streptomyces cyaneofuscatus TaxID=66883 RepID=UPI0036BE78B8